MPLQDGYLTGASDSHLFSWFNLEATEMRFYISAELLWNAELIPLGFKLRKTKMAIYKAITEEKVNCIEWVLLKHSKLFSRHLLWY